MTDLSILSWNWCVWTQSRDHLKLALLDRLEWDIAALQEVSAESAAAIRNHFPGADVISGLDFVDTSLAAGQAEPTYGSAIVLRRRMPIDAAGWVPIASAGEWRADSVPLAASLVHASVALNDDRYISVVAAHAPHSAGSGDDRRRRIERKVRTYLDLEEWLRARRHPMAVGIDGNAWIDGGVRDLWGQPSADPNSEQYSVNEFFHDGPSRHGCRDVYREWLEADPERLAEVRRRRPEGPLAVTFVRGTTRKVADRFDAVLASPELEVRSVEHDYEDSVAAGSDHSYVLARLGLADPESS